MGQTGGDNHYRGGFMIAPEVLTGEKAYITAWFDNSRTDILKNFHCNGCGAIMFKYYDSLKAIAPGKVENLESGNLRIMKCRGRITVTNKYGMTFNATCKVEYYIY